MPVPRYRLPRAREFLYAGNSHIFVGSKAPWFEITDDLLQNEEL